jgi:hypothetical protein
LKLQKKFIFKWHAESNPPSVLTAFIYANYLYLVQDSSVVFTLASRGMAVSPILLMSSALHHIHSSKDVSFLLHGHASQRVPYGTTVLYDGWSFLSLRKTVSCPSACHSKKLKIAGPRFELGLSGL